MTLADKEKDWYNTTLYKLINGRYVGGEITFTQYDIAVDNSRTGAYTCQFQTGPFMSETETVGKEAVLLYKENHALFTQQEALLSLVHKSAMDPKSEVNAPNDDKRNKNGTDSTGCEVEADTKEKKAEGDSQDDTNGTKATDDGKGNGQTIAAPSTEKLGTLNRLPHRWN